MYHIYYVTYPTGIPAEKHEVIITFYSVQVRNATARAHNFAD